MTPFDAAIEQIGVIIAPQPQQPRPPVVYGWRPSFKGEEPPW